MKERINELLGELGMSANKFAATVGVLSSSLSHIMAGRNNPSLDFAAKVLQAFPNVNPDWWLLGIGEMFRRGNAATKQPKLFDTTPVDNHNTTPIPVTKTDSVTSISSHNSTKNADIEQVMIFYSDKTVVAYKPQ